MKKIKKLLQCTFKHKFHKEWLLKSFSDGEMFYEGTCTKCGNNFIKHDRANLPKGSEIVIDI